MTILITGIAGYIGSHVALAFADAGYDVVGIDNFTTGFKQLVPEKAAFYEGDFSDQNLLDTIFDQHDIDAIVHMAASTVVPESVENPLKYYENNTVKSHALIDSAIRHHIPNFIFSSTAAVYGIPEDGLAKEDGTYTPINPYGWSKAMVERILMDSSQAHEMNHINLRYFNVAGADPDGRAGQMSRNATHLIKVASEAACGKRDKVFIFGEDYPTPDGTCIRDYIHVSDLASAHVKAYDAMKNGVVNRTVNCGYGHGYSVKQVLDTVRTQKDIAVESAPRRAGDPPSLIADNARIKDLFDWTPQYDDLKTIIRQAIDWEKML